MPVAPPPLHIPDRTTAHESFRLQQDYLGQLDKYKEATAVKKALGKMINEAIDNDYLTEFQDPTTYLINQPLHQVLQTLYDRYGFVRRQDLKTVEKDVENMQYELTQPLTVV